MSGHRRDWDDLAELDPLWAILSSPERRFGGGDEETFMASGVRKAAALVRRLERLGVPERRRRALDFGCGVGRISLALADHFDEVTGLDIAPGMVEDARRRAAGRDGVRFLHTPGGDLAPVADERFDLVYSGLVLQHQPSAAHVRARLEELARCVGPGGVLAVQIPTHLSRRLRLQPVRRAYVLLRRLGVPRAVLYRRLRLQPMRMTALPRPEIEAALAHRGLNVLDATEREHEGVRSLTLYAA